MATRQYVGARYVPKFYDYNGSSNWRSGVEYEALTIVTRNGNSYTSKVPVPSNIGEPENNPEYWAATGLYNEQVEAYRQLTLDVADRLNDFMGDGAIGTDNLANGSVTSDKLGDGSVTSDKLDDDSVTSDKLDDGSVTSDKLDDGLKLKVIKDYITPEMFGAVMDGVTDDTVAFQNCVNYSSTNRIPILLSKDIYVNSNINVPSYTRIFCFSNYEYYPYIIFGDNVTIGLNCTGVNNRFENFGIKNASGYRSNTGINLNGGVNYNVDSDITNVSIDGFSHGVIIKGRNVTLFKCGFSRCQIGVYYDLPSDGDQWRGLSIEYCRFHLIGNIPDLPSLFYESAGIFIENNKKGNLTIRNCISDEGGTFIKGYFNNALIEGNFIECFQAIPINIEGVGIPYTFGTILITGNSINGKTGSVQPGVTAPYPEHDIKVTNFGRINISNNVLTNVTNESVLVENTTWCNIAGNFVANCGSGNPTNKALCRINHCTLINITDNMSGDNSVYVYTYGETASSMMFKNNANMLVPLESINEIKSDKQWVLIGTVTANTSTAIDLPKEFLVRANDNETCFLCARYNDYYTSAVSAKHGTLAKTFRFLSLEKSATGVQFVCREFNVADIANPTAFSGTLYIYELRN